MKILKLEDTNEFTPGAMKRPKTPTNISHALHAKTPVKMLLVMIRGS